VHFRHLSAKIKHKNLKQHFDWREDLATPLPKTSKNFLTEKIRPVMPILPSHAGIMLVAEKPWLLQTF